MPQAIGSTNESTIAGAELSSAAPTATPPSIEIAR
jgi:hypothetical protein